jgi:hypothetical protein
MAYKGPSGNLTTIILYMGANIQAASGNIWAPVYALFVKSAKDNFNQLDTRCLGGIFMLKLAFLKTTEYSSLNFKKESFVTSYAACALPNNVTTNLRE